ncbi:hemD [Scenedesmus sp. PABB004]|nr:hemD [Scenedesmus sp. PABB004]
MQQRLPRRQSGRHATTTSSSSSSTTSSGRPRAPRQPRAAAAAAAASAAGDQQQRDEQQRRRQRAALAPHGELPLAGRRVLITAPRQYASKLAGLVVDAGGAPLWVPGVAIARLTDAAALDELDAALARLAEFTHLAFTSRNGILAVLERLAALHGGPGAAADAVAASGVKLCALGADGEALRGAGLTVHVSPAEASTKGLAAELAASGQAAGARVLCPVPHVAGARGGAAAARRWPRPAGAGRGRRCRVGCRVTRAPLPRARPPGGLVEPPVVPRFLAALADAGAHATRVPAYVTCPALPGPAACAAEAALLREGHVAAIAFSSTAEAQGLCLLMGGRDALAAAVRERGVVLAAHGPYTAAGAAEVLGLPVPVVSKSFATFDGLVAALGDALRGPSS